MSQRAIGALWTESRDEKGTCRHSNVSISAIWPVLTETSRIPNAFPHFTVRIDVQVHAFRIRTLPVLAEEPALRHLFQIVLMQEFTIFALFAETAEPVLADN